MPVLTMRVTQAEATAIRRRARQNRVSFSRYAREKLMEPEKVVERHDIITPGCVILDGPPLTTEQIHAALYDDY